LTLRTGCPICSFTKTGAEEKVPTFHIKSETSVNAYDPKDLPVLQNAAKIAEDLWLKNNAKVNRDGTCCGGKGIEIW
jgi:hypothetical protein